MAVIINQQIGKTLAKRAVRLQEALKLGLGASLPQSSGVRRRRHRQDTPI